MKLVTTNVCLDTEFIEGQNFIAGQKMSELLRLANENLITLHITDITYREVLARFKKNLVEADEKTKKPRRELSNAGRVLRNFPDYSHYHSLPDIHVDELYSQFKNAFDKGLEIAGVTIIRTGHLTIEDVVNDYFSNRPPFKEGKKKHEFPDAFTLKAIKEYFADKKTYLLTSDSDLLTLNDDEVVVATDKSAELIDLIIRSSQTKERTRIDALELIVEKFEDQKEQVATQIRTQMELGITDEFGSKSNIGHLRLNRLSYLELSDVMIYGYSIVHLGIDSARIECEFSFSFTVGFEATDASTEWFDYSNSIVLPAAPGDYYLEKDDYNSKAVIDVQFDIENDTVSFTLNNIDDDKDIDIFSDATIRSMRGD